MLYAKEQYIKHMIPRQKDASSFTMGLHADIEWLHDSFNYHHFQKPIEDSKNVVEGVIIAHHNYPSKYKVNKAITILKKHAWVPAINGINGQIDGGASAIFYYAALLLKHADTGTAMYEISPRQRCNISHVKAMAALGIMEDHINRMAEAETMLDEAIETVFGQRTVLKGLQVGLKNHEEGGVA